MDSWQSPSWLSVRLWCSKADPFGMGVTIYLARNCHAICHVLAYMVKQGSPHRLLFLFEYGSPLMKHRLVAMVHVALEFQGVDPTLPVSVTGHSFHIGATTAAV